MSRRQQWVYHIESEEFPPDFPERLDAFRQAAGLSWRSLARRLKVNARTVFRWKAGAAPGSGHLVSLFALAAGMGLLHLLLPEAGELESSIGGMVTKTTTPSLSRIARPPQSIPVDVRLPTPDSLD